MHATPFHSEQVPPMTPVADHRWIELLPDAGALLDGNGTIVATNESWRSLAEQNATPCRAGVRDNFLKVCASLPGLSEFHGQVAHLLASDRNGRVTCEYPAALGGLAPAWYAVVVKAAPDETLVCVRDITGYRRSEESLRARNAELASMTRSLKQTNDELDQYAYVTSHDLKAPLRGIANLSNWIEEDLGDVVTDDAHQQLELLRGRVHRMEALIDGILAYSRVGRVRVRADVVDVGVMLHDMVDLLAPPAGFRVEVAADMPTVVAERTRLQQVFMNLISNAIKHHHHPSHGRVVVAWRDAGECYEFFVTDDGPGIDPAYHYKVWGMFQTLRPRDQVEGTGVGLSLVKKIVEDQGGTVRLESAPGRGATFAFTWQKDVRAVRPQAVVRPGRGAAPAPSRNSEEHHGP